MENRTGYCRFCNQAKLLEVPSDFTIEQLEEEATMGCICREAKEYQAEKYRKEQIECAKQSAKGTTYDLFHDEFPEIEEIFNSALTPLEDKKFKKITINTGGKTKATISFAGDKFKVEREDKSVTSLETEI